MEIKYLFSSPEGDISLEPVEDPVFGGEDLARPFLLTPSEPHPFLTLGDYFESLKEFILKDHGESLVCVLRELLNREIDLGNIRKMLIRSEKHGVLYHLASVEILIDDKRIKLSVSTAVSETGKAWLKDEYEMLISLNASLKLPYLPNVYFKGEVAAPAGKKRTETLAMFLGEWFEDYHEWHLSMDENDGKQKICIWDLRQGHRYASEKESYEIFRQASRILTLYYDTLSYKQIYPWHHAAGDFIVRTRNTKIDVRLTTARKYQSIMDYFSEETVNPMIAVVYFFLNLTVRMRLDKLDGVGKTVWAGDFCVNAITEGFFDAIKVMEAEGGYPLGRAEDLCSLLKSFGEEEIQNLFNPLHNWYQEGDPADFSVIQANLRSHVNLLCHALQDFRL